MSVDSFSIRAGSQTLIAGRKRRERERETAWCLHTNLLLWLGFLESRNTQINLVTTASDEDPCADPESFVRRGATLTFFLFSFFRGERIQLSLKAGHHRPASEAPFINGVSLGCR